MNKLLIEKLQRVYNANVGVANKNFDMDYWRIDNKCQTTACLVGNSILNDPFFSNNGLCFDTTFINYRLMYGSYTEVEALLNFFSISEMLSDILFCSSLKKKNALAVLEMTIKLLQDNNEAKLSCLLLELCHLPKNTIDYFYEHLKDKWGFVTDNNLNCIEEIANFVENVERKHDVSFIHKNEKIYDCLLKEKDHNDLPKYLYEYLEELATQEILNNAEVEVNKELPTVFIKRSDGSEYFFEEDKARKLLDSVPVSIHKYDYLVAIALGW